MRLDLVGDEFDQIDSIWGLTASKRYFSFVLPRLDGEVFPTFAARRRRLQDRKCFKIVRTNGLVVKENTKLQNFDNISCLAFFRLGIYG